MRGQIDREAGIRGRESGKEFGSYLGEAGKRRRIFRLEMIKNEQVCL